MKVAIQALRNQSRETYGTRRIQLELLEQGFVSGRDRIARLRRELGLHCKQRRKFRAMINSNHGLPAAANVLKQQFAPTAPNQV